MIAGGEVVAGRDFVFEGEEARFGGRFIEA